jgi:hypothetical protein
MDPEDLRDGLESALGRERFSGKRLRLLADITAIYEEERVLRNGEALPLWRDCTCAEPCWRAFPKAWRPGRGAADTRSGAILFPWIGKDYDQGGVVVLGINLRDASDLYVEYEIAWKQLQTLEAGGMKPHGSWWAYRSARSAAAVLRSIAGERDLDVEDPAVLAEVLDATARLQAIKCSARDGARSARTPEMSRNCPPRYLRREIRVVRPSVLVSFGYEAWDAIEAIGHIDESVGHASFSRSLVRVDDLAFEMVWLHHPSAPGTLWQKSFDLLLENLEHHPVGGR